MGKIRQAARMRSCSLRLPGCRNEVETTVFAHAPCVDKGMGIKSPDWWGAFSCNFCHRIVDGSKRFDPEYVDLYQARWLAGIYETQKTLIEEGLLSYTET
jgi:hypothetical protein